MSKLAATFWTPEPLAPIEFLAGLRDIVLERSHTRLPKWRFRLAPDWPSRSNPSRRKTETAASCSTVRAPG